MRLLANRVNARAQQGRKTKRLVMTPKPLVDNNNAESGNRKLKYVRLVEKKFEVSCDVNLLTGMPESSITALSLKEIGHDDCNTKLLYTVV